MISQVNRLTHTSYENNGKGIDSVGERQRRRKITTIKESCKKALWFLDSFNVNVTNVILKMKMSDEIITLNYSNDQSENKSECQTLSASQSLPTLSSYQSISTTSHQSTYLNNNLPSNIDEILFLLDSFGVSDEFYHELSMCHPSLPRSYLINERRKCISSNIEIHRLPRPYFGWYQNLTACIEEVLVRMVSSHIVKL